MDIYGLNENLQRESLTDLYESFIWTERFRIIGDFELVVRNERKYKNRHPIDSYLLIPESARLMVVETHEEYEDNQGRKLLKISGRSMESFMENRSLAPGPGGLSSDGTIEYVGTPGQIVRQMFHDVYTDTPLSPYDDFPFLEPGTSWYDDIPEPSEEVTLKIEPQPLYDAIKLVCDTYDMGFKIEHDRGPTDGSLKFGVTMGDNRTQAQSNNIPVIFSPELDSLSNTQTLTSKSGYKNVAYVYTQNKMGVVYADGTDEDVSGFDRRVLTVIASDIDLPEGAELDAAIIQKGREELAKNKLIYAFDGEIAQDGKYVYSSPNLSRRVPQYGLGDLVVQQNQEGYATTMKVTEQIFSSDRTGDKSYPTLAVDTLVTPGSWRARPANQVWDDVPTSEYWADLP